MSTNAYEKSTLQKSENWELVTLPFGKFVVGCRCVFVIKVDRLKARLVAKGYTQIFGLDYGDTFSLVTKMTSIHLFITMIAFQR